MPPTALYRRSTNEVLKISLPGQPFTDADPLYFGVLTNPALPNGAETVEQLADGTTGPRGQVGFAKWAMVAQNRVRNATAAEIAGWAAGELNDENQQDADQADRMITSHPVFRKMIIGLLRTMLTELNVLRAQAGLPPLTAAEMRTALRANFSRTD